MAVTITCPRCATPLCVEPQWSGQTVRCPRCNQSLVVPVVATPLVQSNMPMGQPRTASSETVPSFSDSSHLSRVTRSIAQRKRIGRRTALLGVVGLITIGTVGWAIQAWFANRIVVVEWRTMDSISSGGFGSNLKPMTKDSKFLVVKLQLPSKRFCSYDGQKCKPLLELTDFKVLLNQDGKQLELPASGARDVYVGLNSSLLASIDHGTSIAGAGFRPSQMLVQTMSVDNQPTDYSQPVVVSFFVLAPEQAVAPGAIVRVQIGDDAPIMLPDSKRE